MGRYARDKSLQNPKPVERIELSEKNVGIRIAIVAVLILIAIISFGYGISQWLSVDAGWTEIEVDSAADTNSSNEFVLMYELGSREDMSITAEKKGVIALYTEVMEDAYQIFHNNAEIEGVKNLYYLNRHTNEEIQVDDMLYHAFELLQKYENRIVYLAPIYEQYNNLFDCEADVQTKDFDPYQNEALAAEFKEIAAFAQDATAVQVELLGNNTVKLHVSEVYQQYAEENGITNFVDFAWMKNAFIVDYLAEKLFENGYKTATISSYDGFSRNLDESGSELSYNLYDYEGSNVLQAARVSYTTAKSVVAMNCFPINSLDVYRYYVFEDGQIRSSYLDDSDGLCKNSVNSAYVFSEQLGCAEIMLQAAPLYISDKLDMEAWNALKQDAISVILVNEKTIFYNEEALKISDVYSSYSTKNMN